MAKRQNDGMSNFTEDNAENEEETTQNETGDLEKEPSENTVCQFFLTGSCRFGDRCRNTHVGTSGACMQPTVNEDNTSKGKTPSEPKGKKPPMKTATDVISRIQWDPNLPKEHFSVGYLDRFLGVIEKPFSAFCWEDLASTGVDVLAIPKHRIHYFKYQELMVWDKTTRCDDVFGSTGSGMTILDVIEQYKTLVQPETDAEEMQHFASDLLDEDEEQNNSTCNNHLQDRSSKKVRPTHFIAVRIISEEVRSSIKEAQDALTKHNSQIAEFLTPLPELHLTLCLLHLVTPDDIEIALTVLQEMKTEIQRILPPSLIISFDGLKDFHSRVLYLAPMHVPGLLSFVDSLNQRFASQGLLVINPPSSNSFHVTVAKVPRNMASKNPSLQFLPEVYNSIQHPAHFGAQHIDSISLCYAGRSRRTDGFYTTLLELPLY